MFIFVLNNTCLDYVIQIFDIERNQNINNVFVYYNISSIDNLIFCWWNGQSFNCYIFGISPLSNMRNHMYFLFQKNNGNSPSAVEKMGIFHQFMSLCRFNHIDNYVCWNYCWIWKYCKRIWFLLYIEPIFSFLSYRSSDAFSFSMYFDCI